MRIRWIVAALLVAVSRLCAFELALPGYEFEFPRDHFEHPEFEIEWWYYTGNIQDEGNRPFGFELTFFRVSVELDSLPESAWDVGQVYLAHFAVSDIASERFYSAERVNRAGPGLAGASHLKGRIWNGNWSTDWEFPDAANSSQRLRAVTDEVSLDLSLRSVKPPVVHGVDGISRKAAGKGKASHYISLTRLHAEGTVAIGDAAFTVSGSAWMDHEFSTDSMGSDQVGWDWMSVQLDDGTELMLYGMRDRDGSHGEFSSGTFVDVDGRPLHLNADEFSLEPKRTWRSPETGAVYPVAWEVVIPSLGYSLASEPLMDSQEIVSERGSTPTYWEGAVRYAGRRHGADVAGVGYLEMTGYEQPVWLGLRSAGH